MAWRGAKTYRLKVDRDFLYSDGVRATILVADGPWPEGEKQTIEIVAADEHHMIVDSFVKEARAVLTAFDNLGVHKDDDFGELQEVMEKYRDRISAAARTPHPTDLRPTYGKCSSVPIYPSKTEAT